MPKHKLSISWLRNALVHLFAQLGGHLLALLNWLIWKSDLHSCFRPNIWGSWIGQTWYPNDGSGSQHSEQQQQDLQREQGQKKREGQRQQQQQIRSRLPTTIEMRMATITGRLQQQQQRIVKCYILDETVLPPLRIFLSSFFEGFGIRLGSQWVVWPILKSPC